MQNLNEHMSQPFKSFFGIFHHESEGHLKKSASLRIVQNKSEEARGKKILKSVNFLLVEREEKNWRRPCFSMPSFLPSTLSAGKSLTKQIAKVEEVCIK